MIEHAVLLAVRPGTPEADVDAMLAGLRGLDGIDGVLSVSVGPTFTDRGKQFTHGLIVRLASRIKERGLTLVPLRLYFSAGRAKIELALVRGKRSHDRREDIKRRDAERETRRAARGRGGAQES